MNSQILPEIHDKSLAIQIYELIRRQIGSGELRPGERILEGKFIEELGISRTPIREALLRLERDGLVVCTSRRSYNVRILTAADVKEIYDTLGILESACAGLVVRALTAEDIRLLKEFNQEMARAVRNSDHAAFGEFNHKFHDIFLGKLDNHIMREVCDSLRALLYVFPVHSRSLTEWMTKSIREHREIICLAEAGDRKALESYFRDIHWSSERNLRYILDAHDLNGKAALPAA